MIDKQARVNRNLRLKISGILTFLEETFVFERHDYCCTPKVCAFETPGSCSKRTKENPTGNQPIGQAKLNAGHLPPVKEVGSLF